MPIINEDGSRVVGGENESTPQLTVEGQPVSLEEMCDMVMPPEAQQSYEDFCRNNRNAGEAEVDPGTPDSTEARTQG